MNVAETGRLRVRWLERTDAGFILRLVNEPSWIEYIGDKGVRTREDAVRYIENGPVAMYARVGFGLYLVELQETREPTGMTITLPDIGTSGVRPTASSSSRFSKGASTTSS